jgi:hypothetical protein
VVKVGKSRYGQLRRLAISHFREDFTQLEKWQTSTSITLLFTSYTSLKSNISFFKVHDAGSFEESVSDDVEVLDQCETSGIRFVDDVKMVQIF